uniref:NADH-ubiquinone oxidoreductase chain 4 n=1 Tax=Helicella itala TaxID=76043 RepID=A0A1S5R338_9EUPU|nr:NADH dehydrogenase subunit 4 [Helicella itala]
MSLVISLLSILLINSFEQAMITFCFCLPFALSTFYKTCGVLEDVGVMYNPLGVVLGFLTLSLMILIMLASSERAKGYYIALQVILGCLLVMCFITNNLLTFYVLFEVCLIPILLMILQWGYQPERLQAGMYMVMYTVMGSLPLLVIILYLYAWKSTYHILTLSYFSNNNSFLFFWGLAAFMIKLPVYGVHVWLPKAHVEAPLGGSMILAGVLLKLGGYGMYLYSCTINISWTMTTLGLALCLISLWGGVLASLACMSQNDIKALIAYSSIVHMSFIILGLLSGTSWGVTSAIVIMVAHGWASSALFFLSYATYQVAGSRSFSYTKGMLKVMPVLSAFWFIFCMVNMGFPPTINFLGEIMLVPVSLMWSFKIFIPVGVVMFMSVVYNMYLYTEINHGMLSNYLTAAKTMSHREYLTLLGHLLPMIFVINMYLLY